MKTKNYFLIALAFLTGSLAIASCDPEVDPVDPVATQGSVKGKVTDGAGSALVDVNVTLGSLKAVTAADGTYSISNVTMEKANVVFEKTGFSTTSVPINEKSFKDGVATIDAVMEVACASISGKCINDSSEPFAGVKVTLNGAVNTTTDADGAFKFENLTLKEYTLVFTATDCAPVEIIVPASSFTAANNYSYLVSDVRLGTTEILPGLTFSAMEAAAQPWYYNELRGGRNGDDFPHFDWSSDQFYCYVAYAHMGWIEEQNEGTTIQIQNREEEGHWNNPASLDYFDSYIFGRKLITEDNCKMYLKVRTHGGLAKFGVMVVDPTEATPKAVRIGDVCEWGSDSYTTGDNDFEFDLTPYIGKEIYIAIGQYRAETGNYWHQVVLRRIVFAKTNPEDWGWCPGDDSVVKEGWHLTKEMIRSTMPVEENVFTGISQIGADMFSYYEAYANFRQQKHILGYWASMPLRGAAEPFDGQGTAFKTNGNPNEVNQDIPHYYLYAKFAITPDNDHLTLSARTFNGWGHDVWFNVLAIKEDCTYDNLEAKDIVIGHHPDVDFDDNNFCERVGDKYKLFNEGGEPEYPELYTTLGFDLSAYQGQNIVLAIAVYKAAPSDQENKLCIKDIILD